MSRWIHFPYHARVTRACADFLDDLGSAPARPEPPRVELRESGLVATWKKVEGAIRYLVFVRRARTEWEQTIEAADTTASFQKPKEGEGDYQVSVAALDARGNISILSSETTLSVKK
ncbi:hypothetical protein HY251_04580 [bacterium]|nr:hypothetical protein [bacterium]